MRKLGLIAGGGGLPLSLARHCRSVGREVFVIRLKGFADPELSAFDGADVGLARLGLAFRELDRAGCRFVCFAGVVSRPDFQDLKPDLRGLAAMPGALAAARTGDDGLLRFLVREFEKEGFAVEGAHDVMQGLTLPAGAMGRNAPTGEHLADIERGLFAARAVGRLDAGQGAVCRGGVILALEAQEGTDAMLARVARLPRALRGVTDAPSGVLAKAPKPDQDNRIDLPTIGPTTLRLAAQAGLAGVAGEAGGVLVIDREDTVAVADELGLFVFGVSPGGR